MWRAGLEQAMQGLFYGEHIECIPGTYALTTGVVLLGALSEAALENAQALVR